MSVMDRTAGAGRPHHIIDKRLTRSRAGVPMVAVVHQSSGGHVRPLLPLVAALRARGARTVQWARPEWEAECATAGGEFRALPDVGIDLDRPPPNLIGMAELVARVTERMTPWMTEQLRSSGVDVVLRDTLAHHGRYAAYEAGLPQVAFSAAMAFPPAIRPALLSMPALRSMPAALAQLAAGTPDALRLRRVARRLEQRYGAPMGGSLEVLGGRYGCTTLVGTSRGLQIHPEGLADEDLRFVGPLRAASAPAAGEEPALAALGEDEELVYVSLGTVFEDRPAFFRDAARALARPGRRVILSVGRIAPRTLGVLPTGVTAHAHVDQLAVLRRANLFITHGGFNSMQEGLVAGVPLLVFPQMQEQVLNADRVSELGAGLRLRRATAARIGAQADLILRESRFRAAARRTGAELRAAVDLASATDAVLSAAVGHTRRAASSPK
jgi:MGT family glycosyltransferase